MNAPKTISLHGRRSSLGLIVLSVPLAILLISIGHRLLSDVGKIPTPPDRQSITEAYRSRLQDGSELWQQMQPEIETTIDAEFRQTLLQGAQPLAFDGKTLHIGIPDAARRDAADLRLRKQLRDALQAVSGNDLDIQLYVYRGWSWVQPIDIKHSELQQQKYELERSIRDLSSQKDSFERALEGEKKQLDVMVNVQNAKSAAGESLTPDERNSLEGIRSEVRRLQNEQLRMSESIRQEEKNLSDLNERLEELVKTIEDRDRQADTDFWEAERIHKRNQLIAQSLLVFPLLIAAAYILIKKRKSRYIVIYSAFIAAVVWIFWVFLQKHVDPKWLYYLIRGIGASVVLVLMANLIRRFHRVNVNQLMIQIREAILSRRCPNCGFPYYGGSMKRDWHWKTTPMVDPHSLGQNFCQNCGLPIMDQCAQCGAEKYALLPHCPKCNAETDVCGTYQTYLNDLSAKE